MKNKNILLSTGSYVVAVIWFFAVAKPLLYNYPYFMLVTSLLGLYGAFMGYKSIKQKEIPVLGYFLVLIGLVIVVVTIGILRLELSPI